MLFASCNHLIIHQGLLFLFLLAWRRNKGNLPARPDPLVVGQYQKRQQNNRPGGDLFKRFEGLTATPFFIIDQRASTHCQLFVAYHRLYDKIIIIDTIFHKHHALYFCIVLLW
jgi:hypothetical protein